ncbi:Alpha/Beta hydrolase protein [Astrocystis sublimbata]|nr:Alpha/Beta hydrolase protein [Astrocystis sublimbata]
MEKPVSGRGSCLPEDEASHTYHLAQSNERSWLSRAGRHLRRWCFIYILIALALYSNTILRGQLRSLLRAANDDRPTEESSEHWTDWEDITPSEKLQWKPCFGTYGPNLQCAKLTVPMDYSRPLHESSDHPKVHLALVMATGSGRTQDPSTYAEAPLLINPGGPGGSGTFFAQSRAANLQVIVGDQHDIIGFDPRGVGFSSPKADCFESPKTSDGVAGRNVAYLNRITWQYGSQAIGLTNTSNVALTQLSARSRAQAKLCQRVDEAEGDDSIFRHMDTPNHARDMLSIIDAWHEWRSNSEIVRRGLESHTTDDAANGKTSLQGKLVYWGFSYGTLLGATFASMFPDRVGRVILDGVVHADHYVKPTWDKSLVDTDAIWDKFFVYCAEAQTLCDFYRAGDEADDIRRRFSGILSSLDEQPAAVLLPDTNLPTVFTASDVKKAVFFGGLYAPVTGFPVVATLLDRLADGRYEEIVQGARGLVTFCGKVETPIWPDDAMRGIACSDKRHKSNESVAELQARYERAASVSWFADVWFGLEPNLGCNGWEVERKNPPMRWHDNPDDEPTLIETNFPVLFLSNKLDPVTPLGDALYMTRKFANASVIEQDGLGHCTLSCVSPCTIAHVRAYLNDGVVPPPPKFKSSSSNEGEWPQCKCIDGPWRTGDDVADAGLARGAQVGIDHMRAYEGLRAYFSAQNLDQQLEYNNPFSAFLLERTQ